jgi:hypothetical protein
MQRPLEGSGDEAENLDPGYMDVVPDNDASVSDVENSTQIQIALVGEKVTFHHITERCTELARAVQNDQVSMNTLFSNINQMIDRARLGQDIHINFSSGILETFNCNANIDVNCPRAAVSRVCTNSTGVKRNQSTCEFNTRHCRKHKRHVSMSQVMALNDDIHLPPAIVRTRSCTVCRNKGHGVQNCPMVTKYGDVPLQKNNQLIRERLGKNLSVLSKYATNHQPVNDERTVFTELPALKEVKGLVIHKRFLINSSLFNPDTEENLALECTVIHLEGKEHPSYTRQLFGPDCPSAYINRRMDNVIMSQLEESTAIRYPQPQSGVAQLHEGVPPFSQQSQYGMPQFLQQLYTGMVPLLSQQVQQNYSTGAFDTMGYGLAEGNPNC